MKFPTSIPLPISIPIKLWNDDYSPDGNFWKGEIVARTGTVIWGCFCGLVPWFRWEWWGNICGEEDRGFGRGKGMVEG